MIGNPKNFILPTPQEMTIVLDFNKISTLSSFEIITNGIDNESISNIEYKIGYDVANEENKTFKIDVINGTSYSLSGSIDKSFVPLWINKDGNKYIGFTDGNLSELIEDE
jgi:hypothetical protein